MSSMCRGQVSSLYRDIVLVPSGPQEWPLLVAMEITFPSAEDAACGGLIVIRAPMFLAS